MFSQKGIQRHPVKEWNEREVYRWLKQKGLSKLWRHFRDKKLDGKLLLQTTGQYLDRLGVSNPTTRDKLLAAVHELKLFGGPVPDERQFRLNVPGNNNNGISPRTKKRSLPERPPGNAHLFLKEILNEGTPSSRGIEVVERKTPQEVLHEQNDQMCQEVEKGEVLVHTAGLQFDMEDITVEITNHSTSKELVSLLLAQCKADSKDPNLFYIAVETGMQKKDSSLPISQMMVLADDDRPLEIQSRQPSGEAKLHLKMRSGGLLRVQAGILSPGATYKCVQISRQTRADEVVKMILSSYGSDEPPEKFVLVESLSDSEVGRILEADECPLEVQSQWELGEQRTFTLTLAEFEGVLQSEDKDVSLSGETDATQQSSNDYDKNNEDQPMNSSSSEIEEKETTEQIRRRRTSIDALDLQLSQINQVNEVNQVKRKVSQIDNLRHKFQEYHRKPSSVTAVDETAISGSGEGPKRRKVSQIDRFRSKFLEYAQNSGKGETGAHNTIDEEVKDGDNASRKKTPPSRVSSDSEELPRFSSSPPSHLRNNNNHNDVLRENEKDCGNRFEDSVDKNSKSNRLSLASVLKHSKLVTVTLNKQPGEGWGLELVHVTRTGSPMSQHDNDATDDEKVVYVLHSGNGQNSIVGTSSATDSSGDLFSPSGISTPHSLSSSGSSEHEITSILGTSSLADKSQDMRHILHKQSLKRRKIGTCNQHLTFPALSPILSRPGSAPAGGEINPLPQRPSSAFAQWSKDGSPQPRPGVRIVALTEGGVAATSGELAVDDLIVEIDGKFLLNSPLEPVIAALQETNTVTIVVARAQAPETKSEEKENVTDCKEDIKALTLQIQNLVTKVSEMQNDLKKKDDKIKSLKKMVRKNSADSKGKIYQSVQVLV